MALPKVVGPGGQMYIGNCDTHPAPTFTDWGPLIKKKAVHGMGQHFFREYGLRNTDMIKTKLRTKSTSEHGDTWSRGQ